MRKVLWNPYQIWTRSCRIIDKILWNRTTSCRNSMESKLTMERILHYYRKEHLKSYRILPVYLLNSDFSCIIALFALLCLTLTLFGQIAIKSRFIECFHSRGQHLCKFIETKESVCIRKEFNSHRTSLGHQHGRRFIVLGHQYGRRDVM